MCPPGHAEWGVCLLLEQVVGLTNTRQFVMRAAEWVDQGGQRQSKRSEGASDRGREGYGAVVSEVMTRSRSSPLMVTSNH